MGIILSNVLSVVCAISVYLGSRDLFLHAEPDAEDVPVLHDVVFAFQPETALFLNAFFRPAFDEVSV